MKHRRYRWIGLPILLFLGSAMFLWRAERSRLPAQDMNGQGPLSSNAGPGVAATLGPAETRARAPELWLPVYLRLAYAQQWDGPQFPELERFRDWTRRFIQTSSPGRTTMINEGVQLAAERRQRMRELIQADPERAIAWTVPVAVRDLMPPPIEALLERRVSGQGNFDLLVSTPAPGEAPTTLVSRDVSIGQEIWQAFVYGRRKDERSKSEIPLHGIAIDSLLALHESPLRVLEPGEKPRSGQKVVEICDVSSLSTNVADSVAAAKAQGPTAVEVAGVIHVLCVPEHVNVLEQRLLKSESGVNAIGPLTQNDLVPDQPLAASWSDGTKQVLVIRVDFPDGGALSGGPYYGAAGSTSTVITPTYAANLLNSSVNPFYQDASGGLTSLVTTVAGNVYRMPQTATYYATGNRLTELHTSAENAAAADGYVMANYDRIAVVFSNLSGIVGSQFIGVAGWGAIGGKSSWINGWFDFRDVAHELGHNYGAWHANSWTVSDGNPVSNGGTHLEYGDSFDVMGGLTIATDAKSNFNHRHKSLFGWLPAASVTTVKTSGTYRIYRFDHAGANPANPQALRIFREGVRRYWIGYRQKFTANNALTNGAYVLWGFGDDDVRGTELLDMTTPGSTTSDAALAVGATFSDSNYGVTISPVARGGTAPNEYLDVSITLLPLPTAVVASWGYGGLSSALDVPMGLVGVKSIASGADHALALKADGKVVAWGNNTYGQTNIPTSLGTASAIAAGRNVSGAVKADGTVVLWGENTYGVVSGLPSSLANVRQLAIGSDHALALKNDGTVVAWGSSTTNAQAKVVPSGLTGVVAIAAGSGISFALKSDGTVTRWGANYGGTLPSGNIAGIASAGGATHVLILKTDGTVAAWGSNFNGQATIPSGLSGVTAIATGDYHSFALKSDGTVVSLGNNLFGVTTPPADLPAVTMLAGGSSHSLALLKAGPFTPAMIVVHPQPKSVALGAGLTLSVTAGGTGPFTYQWYKGGVPISGATGALLKLGSVTLTDAGSYSVLITDGISSVLSSAAQITVNYSRLIALSVRSLAGSGENTLIAGLVVAGSGSKPLVFRGVGPTLSQAGVSGVLTDPQLRLFNSSGQQIQSNDDWGGGSALRNAFAAVGLSALPADSKDAAIFSQLATGVYTTHVVSTVGTGVALMEIYDAGQSSDAARLTAFSVRNLVGTGGNILIVGLVVSGNAPKTFVVRGVGSTLAQVGIAGFLVDPQLKVFNGAGQQILANDDWGGGTTLANAFLSVGMGALPANSKDAAMLLTLEPGVYTVQLSGGSNSTGVGLIEVYEMP